MREASHRRVHPQARGSRETAAAVCADQSHSPHRLATVVAEAERLLTRITEQYFSRNLTVEEMRQLARSRGCRSNEDLRRSLPPRAQVDTRPGVIATPHRSPTKSRQNADASLTTRRRPSLTLTPMSNPATASIPFRRLRVLAASLALALAGCATPVLKSCVEVPDRFAAARRLADEPEVAWWEGFSDPVLSDLIRRAAQQNRDVKIAAERVRAARAGETISRSWLFPSVGVGGDAFDHRTNYDSVLKNFVPEAANTRAAQGGVGVSWEVDISGRLRAGATAAAADALAVENGARGVRLLVLTDVASQLLHARRRTAPARDGARDIGRAGRDAAPRHGTPAGRPRDAVRRRARADRSVESARRDTAARNARRRFAAPHRRADRRPGVQRREHHAVGRRADGSAGAPGQPAALLQRRPDLLAASAQLDAANARRQQAQAEWFPRLFLGAVFGRESIDLNGIEPRRGALHQCRGAARDADLQRRPHAGDQRHRRERSTRSRPALRGRDRARARGCREHARRARRRTAARGSCCNSASASAEAALGRAQSLYDRGQIDLLPLLDAQRVRLAVRVSANDSQHATAARQRAALQGARRRLAGIRARRRARCSANPQPPKS